MGFRESTEDFGINVRFFRNECRLSYIWKYLVGGA